MEFMLMWAIIIVLVIFDTLLFTNMLRYSIKALDSQVLQCIVQIIDNIVIEIIHLLSYTFQYGCCFYRVICKSWYYFEFFLLLHNKV